MRTSVLAVLGSGFVRGRGAAAGWTGGSPRRPELAARWAGSPERGAPVTEGWGPWRGDVCWGPEEGLWEVTVTVTDLPGRWKQQDALECAGRSLAGAVAGGWGLRQECPRKAARTHPGGSSESPWGGPWGGPGSHPGSGGFRGDIRRVGLAWAIWVVRSEPSCT